MKEHEQSCYVSRGGEKLHAALREFNISARNLVCADLGCNVGGFTDCLLQHGAAKVYAVDTGYGELAWRLRKDDRVVVMERTNALHLELPEPVSLVTVDVAWTRQHLIVPVAGSLLARGGSLVTLIKPHYEAEKVELRKGVLQDEKVQEVVERVRLRLEAVNVVLDRIIESPIRGRKGNREFLALASLRS